MEEKLRQHKEILGQVSDLNQVAGLLGWDQQTYMPPGAAEGRGYQTSTLRTLAHIKFTSDEVGQLLEDLQTYAGQLDADVDDARLIRVTQREYTKSTRVPAEMVGEFSRAAAVAHNVWEEARAESNFEYFRPHLEHLVDLRRQYAELFAPYEHVYDPLLDDFEPGLKTADVLAIFNTLRPQQVALIQEISAQPP
ncbi:MAG: carboxypeptidase M32, partial [Anaerolineae bacterium]